MQYAIDFGQLIKNLLKVMKKNCPVLKIRYVENTGIKYYKLCLSEY